MKELAAIVEAYNCANTAGNLTAIATVVDVIGSSYRSPGARMLVSEDGQITGAISGGCLEGDALKKALYAIKNKTKRVVIYDTTDESDASLGIQLGCNGTVYILFEPINLTDLNNPIQLIKHAIKFRQDAVIITVFSKDLTAKQTGTILALNSESLMGDKEYLDKAKSALNLDESIFQTHKNEIVFSQIIHPPISLIIAGAGNDVIPLVNIASELGWQITIIDSRPSHAVKKRFPQADKVEITNTLANISTDSRTAILLMSHNYNYDLKILGEAVKKETFYIGILGPKEKRDRMVKVLSADANTPKIHGPMGLDIGAENAAEIALSIIAEIQAKLTKKSAAPLRNKSQPIHQRSACHAAS